LEQLFGNIDDIFIKWSSGSALFFDHYENGFSRLTVAVKCRIGNLKDTYFSLLDTGAEWSVIGGEISEILECGSPIAPVTMSTRHGRLSGHLHRINISLLADPGCGLDLNVESTVAILSEWSGPIVLGYRGFLERLRFALDPGVMPGSRQQFYFGA